MTPTAVANGMRLFLSSGCASCHTLANAGAKGKVGPNLDGAKPSRALVVDRVTNGQGVMPPFKDRLSKAQIEAIASEFGPSHWRDAFASSGTAAALAEILEQNAFSPRGITAGGLARLKKRMIQAGNVHRLHVSALKPERAPVLAGGLAIMTVAVAELRIPRIDPVGGALRLGVLYDLLGRTIDEDVRQKTVERFVDRYRIEPAHAARVAAQAVALYRRIALDG